VTFGLKKVILHARSYIYVPRDGDFDNDATYIGSKSIGKYNG